MADNEKQAERPEQTPEQDGRAQRPADGGKPVKADKAERGDKPDKGQRPEKAEKGDKAAKSAKPDKAEKADKTAPREPEPRVPARLKVQFDEAIRGTLAE